MRESLRRLRLPYLTTLGVLLVAIASGCSQGPEESGQTSGDRAATQAGTTVQSTIQETTAAGGGATAQGVQEGTQEKTGEGQTSQQQRQQAQQQAEQQRQQAQQQKQQAQQQNQNQQGQQQQGQQQTVTVRITGTEGLAFSGRVGSAQELKRVEGSVPKEYELPFRGGAATAAVRKQEPGRGTLRVEVVRGGEVIASQETSSAPGILNIVWTPQ